MRSAKKASKKRAKNDYPSRELAATRANLDHAHRVIKQLQIPVQFHITNSTGLDLEVTTRHQRVHSEDYLPSYGALTDVTVFIALKGGLGSLGSLKQTKKP